MVCPSYSEGMPTVILEAMSRGCAIIATDVGAVTEEVDLSNGWVLPELSEQSLTDVIVDAIECDDHLLIQKKIASFQKIQERFDWNIVVDKHIEGFASLIKQS